MKTMITSVPRRHQHSNPPPCVMLGTDNGESNDAGDPGVVLYHHRHASRDVSRNVSIAVGIGRQW
jgi:hypothetical protein